MPSTSPAQHRFMEAVAHDPAFARRAGVPVHVGQDFVSADRRYAHGGRVGALGMAYADGGSATLSPDDLKQLQAFWGDAASNPGATMNLGGHDYSTMGVEHNDEGGNSYDPNVLMRQIPGDTSEYYNVDPNTGKENLQAWNHGGGFWSGMLKQDILPVVETLGTMYLGGLGLGALGAGSAAGIGGSGFAAGAGMGAVPEAGAGLAGDVLSKAALDGTTAFGANSVPGAFDLASVGGAGTTAMGAGSGLNPAFDTVGDITNTGIQTAGVGNGAPLPMTSGGWETATLPAAGSTPATSMSFDAALGAGAGAGAGSAVGNSLNIKPMDALKIVQTVNSIVNSGKGGSGSGTGGSNTSTQPFDYGPAQWLPPGWRTDRPMYVPGVDVIPEGWYGAGHTQG